LASWHDYGDDDGGDCILLMIFQAGINAGDYFRAYIIPWTGTNRILNLAKYSNVGLNGRWIFRVDGSTLQLPNKPALTGTIKH
jgi:Nidogen-like